MNAKLRIFTFAVPVMIFNIAQANDLYQEGKGYAYAIGSLTHGPCVVTGINDAGQVVGTQYKSITAISRVGFLTGPKGLGIKEISFPGMDSQAWGVNSKGQVVGIAVFDDVTSGAFITDANGENIRPLNVPGNNSGANGINDLGEAVGTYFDQTNHSRAYMTGPNGIGFKDLGTLGGPDAQATAINAAGQVIGQSTIGGNPGATLNHAFITGPNGMGMRDLGLLGGNVNFTYGLNEAGQVVGAITYYDVNGAPIAHQPYVSGPDGQDLKLYGTLYGFANGIGEGFAINNNGFIAGDSSIGANYKFLYATVKDPRRKVSNVTRLVGNLPQGVYLFNARGINRYNQMAVSGSDGHCYIVCPNKDCRKDAK